MTIIIVGCGKVGITLADHLSRENHDVSIIDIQADLVQSVANTYDVLGVIGNGTSYKTLIEAGIENADLLIAVTNSDELNMLCCLIAKKAGACATIARVRNPHYYNEISFIKEELGLSMVINPELAAATEMARLLRFPNAIEINTFAKGRIELLKFKIDDNSKLHDMQVSDLRSKFGVDILICAVERDHEVFIPSGTFRLKEKDNVFIVVSPIDASAFLKKLGIHINQVRNAMIVGGGTTGYYLANQLINMGMQVKIIEQSKERCEHLCDILPEAMIINGNGIDKDLLLEEGLEQSDAFITLTNMDEENILLSLYAKSQTDAKLVTKVNKISFDQVVESLDLGSIIYPKQITAHYILQYVRARQNSIGSNVETLYKIVDGRAEALEFKINENAPVIGIPLERLNLKPNLLICTINRGGRVFTPRGQDTIENGDTVILVTTNTGLHDISDILN